MKASDAETRRLKLACRSRCRAVAGQRSSSRSRNNVKLFRSYFFRGVRHLAVCRGYAARICCCIFEKKESAASDALYRNFYLTLKSTKQ
ncbi:hypothetical protein Bpro_2156 [Polaromonas sp. JS666]|nr:hypothetical protein Bpro_2156 [Polaromonas sp. JS666]